MGYCGQIANLWYDDLTPLGYIPCVLKCYPKDKFMSGDYTGLCFHNKTFTHHVFFINNNPNNPSVIDPLFGTYFYNFDFYSIYITQLLENSEQYDNIIIEYHQIQRECIHHARYNRTNAEKNGVLISEGINVSKLMRSTFKISGLNKLNIRIIDESLINLFCIM